MAPHLRLVLPIPASTHEVVVNVPPFIVIEPTVGPVVPPAIRIVPVEAVPELITGIAEATVPELDTYVLQSVFVTESGRPAPQLLAVNQSLLVFVIFQSVSVLNVAADNAEQEQQKN